MHQINLMQYATLNLLNKYTDIMLKYINLWEGAIGFTAYSLMVVWHRLIIGKA